MDASKTNGEAHPGLVDVDEFLKYIGEFNKKQIILQIMFCLMIMPGTSQTLLLTFVGNEPPWKCTGLHDECNTTGVEFDIKHHYYKQRCDLKNRDSWDFVQPKKYSIVTEWDLICNKKELSILASSAIFLGWAFGALVLGVISDRFGRKSVLFPSLAVIIISGFVSGFVNNFWLFFFLRCMIGFAQGGVSLVVFVLAAELVGPRYRALSGTLIWFAFTLALCLVGLIAWLVPDWRKLELIMSAPYAFVLVFWKFVPESVRWLRINDRLDEAESILIQAAKMNGKPRPPVKLSTVIKESDHGTFADLFRPWSICKITLVLSFIWFVNGMVYYGVSLASDDLGGNMYRDFVLTSLVEIPANILVIVLGNRFGRKPSTKWSMLLGALSCGIVAGIPNQNQIPAYNWARVCLGVLGKLCITLSFNELYVWSVEIIPTIVRSQGMGLLQVVSRVGAATAPWVASWLKHFHASVPFAVMGGLTMVAAALCFMLKETKGMATAEVLIVSQGIEEMNMIPIEKKYSFGPPSNQPNDAQKDS